MSTVARIGNSLSDLYKVGPRFFMGGLLSKFSRADLAATTIPGHGQVWVRPGESDFGTVRQVFRDHEYKLNRVALERASRECERILASGMVPVIVDAGANIGAASIWLKLKFPKAAVVAIEPDPRNAALARKNLAALPDVTVLEAAVGGEPGFASVVSADAAWAVKTERAETGCAIVTIDQAVATVAKGKLLIAKIDIEGFESDLFDGDLRWMDDVFAVFVEPHDWMLPGKGSSRSFQAAFGQRDFEIFIRGENLIYVRRETNPRVRAA